MATRSLVDASIDSFWGAAGVARPPTPQELRRRPPPAGSGVGSGRPPPGGGGPQKPCSVGAAPRTSRGGPSSLQAAGAGVAGRAAGSPEADPPPELRCVTVEIAGRHGFNAAAVNGLWHFWRVRCGRLAFTRTAQLEEPPLDSEDPRGDLGGGADDGGAAAAAQKPEDGESSVRLFLHYSAQVDAWLISDAPNTTCSIIADCGPVGGAAGHDLEQNWRVWDGEAWKEDRNVTAEVRVEGAPPPSLQGLRVLPAAPAGPRHPSRERARSQDCRPSPRQPQAPLTARPADGGRPAAAAVAAAMAAAQRTPRPPRGAYP